MATSVTNPEAIIEQSDMRRIAVGVRRTGRRPLVIAAQRSITAALVWYRAAQDREWNVYKRYPIALEEIVAKANCPILGMFGETDHIISAGHVRRFRECLERNNKSHHVEIFGGAPHGWLNDTMPGRHRRKPAEDAWRTQREILARAFDPDADKSPIRQSYKATISPNYDFTTNVRYE